MSRYVEPQLLLGPVPVWKPVRPVKPLTGSGREETEGGRPPTHHNRPAAAWVFGPGTHPRYHLRHDTYVAPGIVCSPGFSTAFSTPTGLRPGVHRRSDTPALHDYLILRFGSDPSWREVGTPGAPRGAVEDRACPWN